MAAQSVYALMKRLEADVTRLASAAQAAGIIGSQMQRNIKLLRRDVIDARLDIRDYELAETRAEQVRIGKDASKRLKQIEQSILGASQYNIFSAIEVAQLSAAIAQLQEHLE